MDDLISRQAAIDALDELCDRECEYSKKQRSVMCGACHLGSAFDAVEALPSAQSEIIRCKKCKHWRSSDHTCHEHSLVSPMMANDFCSRAERREDD